MTLDLLRSIYRGERNPGDLVSVAMVHLFEKCARCRSAFDAWRRELGEQAGDPVLNRYDEAFDRVRRRLWGEPPEELFEAPDTGEDIEAAAAEERLAELISLAAGKRHERIRKQPARYRGAALADLLLKESRSRLPAKPEESYSLARLARAVLQHGKATKDSMELYALALAYQGNALRAQGDLRPAAELIEVSRFLLKPVGGGDRLIQAELNGLEGRLRRAQRQLEPARDLLSRSVLEYALAGRKLDAAKDLLSLAMVFQELGEMDRAIELTAQARESFEEEGAPAALQLYARHNLATMLQESGATAEARQVFEQARELYESCADPQMEVRRAWLEASLARDEGDLATAEAGLLAARDGFLALGVGYDAALAALELATLYAEQGRTPDLKRIAEEIVPVFEAQDVHREAAAALMLFQDAVRAEQVTLRYLVELSRYLERARLDPTLTFQRPA